MARQTLLRNYLDLEQAVVVNGRLRAEGFHAALENEHLHAANPALRFALGSRIIVPEPEWTEADAFLTALEGDAPVTVGEACPACGGLLRRERSLLWAVVGFFYGVPFVHDSGLSICRDCGFRWAPDGVSARRTALFVIGFLLVVFLAFSGLIWRFGPYF